MLYEAKVSYKTLNDEGQEVLKKEQYVVENCECFAQVEEKMYEAFNYDNYKETDVTDIKRSRIREIANGRSSDDEKLFMAEIQDTFTTDDGTEKELKYKILFYAMSIESAMDFICRYIEQGYNMKLVSLKKTNFIAVL